MRDTCRSRFYTHLLMIRRLVKFNKTWRLHCACFERYISTIALLVLYMVVIVMKTNLKSLGQFEGAIDPLYDVPSGL